MYAVDQWEGVACAVAVAATVVVEMKSLGSFCQNVCVCMCVRVLQLD